MKHLRRSLPLSLLLLTGCASMNARVNAGETVSHVNLPRFMGTWYVIANVPTWFETEACNAVERYVWNAKEDRIDVDYTHHEKTPDGPLKSFPQKAWVVNKDTNAEWRIRPLWPLLFAYLVVDVAPDYSWTIIGVPDKKHFWIMARTPSMDASVLEQLIEKMKARGYETAKLRRIPQRWP